MLPTRTQQPTAFHGVILLFPQAFVPQVKERLEAAGSSSLLPNAPKQAALSNQKWVSHPTPYGFDLYFPDTWPHHYLP